MEKRSVRNLTLYFDADEQVTARLITNACERSLDIIRNLWRLEPPANCRVYVMTSWPRFMFHSAPWLWRIYLAVTLPLRYTRIKKVWDMSGGWAQRYGQRRVIGIKPVRLLQKVSSGLRERIFVQREVSDWVQHNTCHELVHVCSDHLQLPNWLHEGLAMVTVDRFAGRQTVKPQTLEILVDQVQESMPRDKYGSFSSDPDTLVYQAVRGYWITRYLVDLHPGLLRSQLARRQSHQSLEGALAARIDMNLGEFWSKIDSIVASYYMDVSI